MSADLTQTVQVGDEELTVADLIEKYGETTKSYSKLQADHTKKSQSLSELEKKAANLQAFHDNWGPLAEQVAANPALAAGFQEVYNNFAAGTLTQSDVNTVQNALTVAKRDGDSEAVKELREQLAQVQSALGEQEIDKAYDEIESRVKRDEIDGYTREGFQKFASDWLEEELGLGDDDEITPKHLKQAFAAYENHLLKEARKRERTPNLTTQTSGVNPPAQGKPPEGPRGLKARQKAVMERIRAERNGR